MDRKPAYIWKVMFAAFVLSAAFLMQVPAQHTGKIDHVVYLIGNTATKEINDQNLKVFKDFLSREEEPFTVIHLGDILKPGDIESNLADLDKLIDVTGNSRNGNMVFIAGDKDWDNSGDDGLKLVRKLESSIEDKFSGSNVFLPSEGCPGPEIIDLSDNLRLIAINSPWWMHPFDKPEAPDSDCKILTREEFLEELKGIIEDSRDRNILIAGHHPVKSAGVYGGHMTLQKHLFPLADKNPDNRIPIPLFGSFYAAYRQNIGTVRDMANVDYQAFIDGLADLMDSHSGLTYVSAHDYSLQLLEVEEGIQVISGSINEKEPAGSEKGTLFEASAYGFTKLDYYTNGTIEIGFYELHDGTTREIHSEMLFQSACTDQIEDEIPVNRFLIPCIEETKTIVSGSVPFPSEPVMVSGGIYRAKGLKKAFLGSLYRTTWTEPVSIPYLNLDTTKTGLTPFALGGGRQTTTLKFRAENGLEYAFRSVDKDLVNALPSIFRKTFLSHVVKEVTATEYPYGAILASSLLDETDILHARPRLYVLPDHPRLGAFQETYAGLYGMLEDRPKDPVDNIPGFMGADDVTRSAGLFRKLYDDNDRRVDAYDLGRARAFDMLIGDWGRHEDNWKWAGYDKGNKTLYRPIPRDRDHAFCRWNGLIPYLADRKWAMPMVESFDYDFHDIKSLTWAGRHVDRFLLTSLERDDWQNISQLTQQQMTDEVIDNAVNSLPAEIIPVSGAEIGEMLKSRREQLPEAIDKYYSLLARHVDVVGSNKHEYYEIERLNSGNVRVKMYKKTKDATEPSGEPLFDREFVRKETREICIYPLAGRDVVNVTGTSDNSILVRVIGGPGKDHIVDESVVKGVRKHTRIYDTPGTDLDIGKESRNKTSDDPEINLYDRKSFKYNTYLPVPIIYYSGDDGLVGSFGINWTTHGFRTGDFKGKYGFSVRAGTSGNLQMGVKTHWNEVLGKLDMGMRADYGQHFPYYNFFGAGNNTQKDSDLFDDDYYKVRIKGLNSEIFSEITLLKRGYFRFGFLFEDYTSIVEQGTFLDDPGLNLPGLDRITLAGINARLYLDLRDREVFATRGFQFLLENSSHTTIDGSSGDFGLAQSYIKYYATAKLGIPATLVLKAGGRKNYGEDIPFYKSAYLGQFNNLRGYRRNRFTGDASLYLNSELRLHLGKVRSVFLPFEAGLIGFYDLGKVWLDGSDNGGWHDGYGGGLYIAPIAREYVFSLQFEFSEEEKMLFRFGLGFIFDK